MYRYKPQAHVSFLLGTNIENCEKFDIKLRDNQRLALKEAADNPAHSYHEVALCAERNDKQHPLKLYPIGLDTNHEWIPKVLRHTRASLNAEGYKLALLYIVIDAQNEDIVECQGDILTYCNNIVEIFSAYTRIQYKWVFIDRIFKPSMFNSELQSVLSNFNSFRYVLSSEYGLHKNDCLEGDLSHTRSTHNYIPFPFNSCKYGFKIADKKENHELNIPKILDFMLNDNNAADTAGYRHPFQKTDYEAIHMFHNAAHYAGKIIQRLRIKPTTTTQVAYIAYFKQYIHDVTHMSENVKVKLPEFKKSGLMISISGSIFTVKTIKNSDALLDEKDINSSFKAPGTGNQFYPEDNHNSDRICIEDYINQIAVDPRRFLDLVIVSRREYFRVFLYYQGGDDKKKVLLDRKYYIKQQYLSSDGILKPKLSFDLSLVRNRNFVLWTEFVEGTSTMYELAPFHKNHVNNLTNSAVSLALGDDSALVARCTNSYYNDGIHQTSPILSEMLSAKTNTRDKKRYESHRIYRDNEDDSEEDPEEIDFIHKNNTKVKANAIKGYLARMPQSGHIGNLAHTKSSNIVFNPLSNTKEEDVKAIIFIKMVDQRVQMINQAYSIGTAQVNAIKARPCPNINRGVVTEELQLKTMDNILKHTYNCWNHEENISTSKPLSLMYNNVIQAKNDILNTQITISVLISKVFNIQSNIFLGFRTKSDNRMVLEGRKHAGVYENFTFNSDEKNYAMYGWLFSAYSIYEQTLTNGTKVSRLVVMAQAIPFIDHATGTYILYDFNVPEDTYMMSLVPYGPNGMKLIIHTAPTSIEYTNILCSYDISTLLNEIDLKDSKVVGELSLSFDGKRYGTAEWPMIGQNHLISILDSHNYVLEIKRTHERSTEQTLMTSDTSTSSSASFSGFNELSNNMHHH